MQLLWNSVFNNTFYFPNGEEKKKTVPSSCIDSSKVFEDIEENLQHYFNVRPRFSCSGGSDLLRSLKAKILSTKKEKEWNSIWNPKQLFKKWNFKKFGVFIFHFTIFSVLKNTKRWISTQKSHHKKIIKKICF